MQIVLMAMFLISSLLTRQVAALPLSGGSSGEPDWRALLERHGKNLAAVTSDADAAAFFSEHVTAFLTPADTPSQAGRQKRTHAPAVEAPASAAARDTAVRLISDLAAWRLALKMKETADHNDAAELRHTLENADMQMRWLTGGDQHPLLQRAVRLAEVLSRFRMPDPPRADLPLYWDYAASVHRQYPRLTGSDDSWVAIAEREGQAGLHRRLLMDGDGPATGGADAPTRHANEADREALALRYFEEHLRPLLLAHLVAYAVRTETDAEQDARHRWLELQAGQEKRKEMGGLARLCGTWQWTVHNHQNHQDHKMVMAFSAPDGPKPSGPRPVKMVVLGDVVYLRWEFQGGSQEDSLLFTGKGQRLEGTFVNSAGAWGSITGKRMASCSP